MTLQGIAITYVGTEDPFIDRIYRSGLTFESGQSRTVPPQLAARFLRHQDVFRRAEEEGGQMPAGGQTDGTQPPPDDTAAQLDAAQKAQEERRQQENLRFELHQQIDSMDKPALREWTKVKFQQDLPGNLGLDKMRDRVKGLVDQFGAP